MLLLVHILDLYLSPFSQVPSSPLSVVALLVGGYVIDLRGFGSSTGRCFGGEGA